VAPEEEDTLEDEVCRRVFVKSTVKACFILMGKKKKEVKS